MKTTTGQRGFTLVELIMVIVVMGIIAGMVSIFMKSPIDAYVASGRRAALTDVADTVVRRMARDIQRALSNSIRTNGSQCLEFIPTKTGARYRAVGAGALDFTTTASSFNMLGSNTTFAGSAIPPDQQIAVGDLIVVYNLGIPGAAAYNSDNTSTVRAPAPSPAASSPLETTITIDSKQFPLESGSYRFQVVPSTENLVSYVCNGSSLHRTVSNSLTTTALCPFGGPIVASNVDCTTTTFNYSGSDLQRNALVSMVLTIKDSSGETVSLQHEVHVSNTP